MSPIEDHISENFVGFCKATCQRCDVNLTRIHLLLEVLEHNSHFSGPVVLLKRMTSGVYSLGMLVLSTRERLESHYQRFNINIKVRLVILQGI